MDRRNFLGALNAGGFAAFCRVGLPLGALAAAAPSHAAQPVSTRPLIKVSWESSRGPMLFDHSYLPIPGEDPRTRPNLLLSDFIQWKTGDTAVWARSVPGVENAAGGGRWICTHCEGSQLIQSTLNRRVDAFVKGADAFIGIVRLGQLSTMHKWHLAAVAQAMRNHGLLGIILADSPPPYGPRATERDTQSHLAIIKSTFDIVIDVDLTKIDVPSENISIYDTYGAEGAWQRYCIATLCAGLAGHDEVPIDSLRNRLCESINRLAGV